jgi:hypothetical protein
VRKRGVVQEHGGMRIEGAAKKLSWKLGDLVGEVVDYAQPWGLNRV